MGAAKIKNIKSYADLMGARLVCQKQVSPLWGLVGFFSPLWLVMLVSALAAWDDPLLRGVVEKPRGEPV